MRVETIPGFGAEPPCEQPGAWTHASISGEGASYPDIIPPGNDAMERERLERLAQYRVSKTPPEPAFDEIVSLAANIFRAPIAFLCTAEATCHWFKARYGIDLTEVPRSISFCDHALRGTEILVVPDATRDPRFEDNPTVTGELQVRFYAGLPLINGAGYKLGTLCVVDRRARQGISQQEADALRSLARIAIDRLELRRVSAELKDAQLEARRAAELAETTHQQLVDAIESLPTAIAFTDKDDRYLFWNRQYVQLFPDIEEFLAPGISYEEVLRRSLRTGAGAEMIPLGDIDSWIARRLADHRARTGTQEVKFRDGRWMRYDQRGTSDGGTICTRIDITSLKQSEDSFRLLFDNNPLPMVVYDLESLRYLAANDAAIRHYGYSREQFLAMTILEVRPPEFRPEVESFVRSCGGIEHGERDWVGWRADGSAFVATVYGCQLNHHGRDAALAAIIDVTDKRKNDEKVRHLALHDPLTGLPNRSQLKDSLVDQLRRATLLGESIALHLIDLDNFKSVNDTLGHGAGDELLVAVAKRLTRCCRAGDLIARLGGDEFAVVQALPGDANEADALASQLVAAIGRSFRIKGNRINIGCSIGIAIGPDEAHDADSLMKNADLALYAAKANGRHTHRRFEPQMQLRLIQRTGLERELRHAVKEKGLQLHYQPLINLQTNELIGYEALLRWPHPDGKMISPAEFIPIAEETGLIVPITSWVLEEACQEALIWPDSVNVAINLSGVLFNDGLVVRSIEGVLASTGIDPRRLELEITESVLLDQSRLNAQMFASLTGLGVKLVMDDFGTGYSSLSNLQKLPFDKVKIDASFVSGLGEANGNIEIVKAILAIGASLNIQVLAEGIETREALDILRALGCHAGQGYFLGRPAPAWKLTEARNSELRA